MDEISKGFVIFGGILITIGFLWHFGLIQDLKIGRLPGDFLIERENFKFYFPLTSGLLLSGLISFIFRFLKG